MLVDSGASNISSLLVPNTNGIEYISRNEDSLYVKSEKQLHKIKIGKHETAESTIEIPLKRDYRENCTYVSKMSDTIVL